MIAAYILRCSDGSYYVGSTRSLEHRVDQHATGLGAVYTSTRLPVELVWFEEFERIDEAYAREKQVQGWSRAKREALIVGDITSLRGLAKKRFVQRVSIRRFAATRPAHAGGSRYAASRLLDQRDAAMPLDQRC